MRAEIVDPQMGIAGQFVNKENEVWRLKLHNPN